MDRVCELASVVWDLPFPKHYLELDRQFDAWMSRLCCAVVGGCRDITTLIKEFLDAEPVRTAHTRAILGFLAFREMLPPALANWVHTKGHQLLQVAVWRGKYLIVDYWSGTDGRRCNLSLMTAPFSPFHSSPNGFPITAAPSDFPLSLLQHPTKWRTCEWNLSPDYNTPKAAGAAGEYQPMDECAQQWIRPCFDALFELDARHPLTHMHVHVIRQSTTTLPIAPRSIRELVLSFLCDGGQLWPPAGFVEFHHGTQTLYFWHHQTLVAHAKANLSYLWEPCPVRLLREGTSLKLVIWGRECGTFDCRIFHQ